MREEHINGHIVLIEDDIAELSIKRFQKYNKYMLVESGIGSNLQDVCRHIDKACTYIKGDPRQAITELQNLKQAMYLASEELTPKYMAFACLVTKIDGEAINDLSDENLKGIVHLLSGHKHRLLDKIIEVVKKKIEEALTLYFPDKFDSAKSKEYYDELKQMTLLQYRSLMGEDTERELEQMEIRMAMLTKPRAFVGKDSAEIRYDKEFEDTCLVIAKETNQDPKRMSVLEYYNALEYLKKVQKEREKSIKKAKKK